MFATPALGVPGVFRVCSIRVNSPAPDEERTTGGAGAGAAGADAEGEGEGAAEGGPRRDASRSSSLFCATGWPTLPKAPVMLSGSPEPGPFSPGAPDPPKGVFDSLIMPLPPQFACPYGTQGYIAICLTVK